MKKVIFIDRDGVINRDPGGWTEHSYVTRKDDFHFLPGSKEAIKKLCDSGYTIVVISNQAGVGRGLFSEEQLRGVTQLMFDELKKIGAEIAKVYYCIHDKTDGCECRKPKPGLFKRCERELDIEARGAYFIGDGKGDIEAGSTVGLRTILVLSGKAKREEIDSWDSKPDYICADLREAVSYVLRHDSSR